MSILGWVPPLFITLVTMFTYYAYVVAMCIFISTFLIEKIILISFFHVLLVMTMWCFARSVFTRPHKPLDKFALEEADWSKMSYDYNWKKERSVMNDLRQKLGILTTTSDTGEGILQYCFNCHNLKPDRCHHCSKCGVCVLKMDHHCPWVNNCVGFHNYKYFLLFLAYISLSVIYVISTSARFVFQFFYNLSNNGIEKTEVSGSDVVLLVMILIYLLIGLVLLPLLNLHRDLLIHNVTTLENSRPVGLCGAKPTFQTFDMGLKANFIQVFGHKKLYWFLPIFTSEGDGMSFPIFNYTPTQIL